ncbi:protein NRT1/ PTR FAMILY 5.5-like [Henckelia pumila]|uniref:protein NRT1/ PTR FAMILY 5.5-like n=1 Tax=Henckelia pumila TaxID=405737 RepID=UPI003C6E7AF1
MCWLYTESSVLHRYGIVSCRNFRHLRLYEKIHVEQIVKPDDEHINIKHRLQISHIILAGLCSLIGALALPYIKAWSLRFGIPAICAVVAMLLFLSGGRDYKRKSPEGSPLTAVCRVLVASAHKRSQPLPLDKRSLYYGDESVDEEVKNSRELTQTHCLGFLEKAAILVEGSSQEDQAKDKWRLCKVSEVEEAKTVIRMVPLWLTFIVVGFVSSHANTYFVEQATHMENGVSLIRCFYCSIIW